MEKEITKGAASIFGLDYSLILSGFFGALIVSLKAYHNDKNKDKFNAIIGFLGGFTTAIFLTPLITGIAVKYQLTSNGADLQAGIGFVLGTGGKAIIEALIDKILSYLK